MGLFNFVKSKGQRATEKQTKVTQGLIKEKKAAVRAMKGGQVAGLSGKGAGGVASDTSLFNAPSRPKKPGKPGGVR